MNESGDGLTRPVKPTTGDNSSSRQSENSVFNSGTDDQQLDNTQPIGILSPGKSTSQSEVKKPKRILWILLGILFVLFLGTAGGVAGYGAAVQSRLQLEAKRNLERAVVQFEEAKSEMAAGQFEMARKRLEYVIKLDPNFPGATELLQQAMIQSANIMTPTPVITPTPIPTPDTRAVDQIFASAEQYLRAKDWDSAIIALENVRKADRTYRAVDVDGFYYIALRNRGIQKIGQGSLEMGIYDLSLAQRFGPLDKEAENYRDWARFYLIGVSFWGVDWATVVDNFSQLVYSIPNLQDSSHITVSERYRIALINYGDELFAKGDACKARDMYNRAMEINPDGKLAPTASYAQFVCSPPTATPTKTVIIIPTDTVPVATTEVPSEVPPTSEPPTAEPPTTEPPPPVPPTDTPPSP